MNMVSLQERRDAREAVSHPGKFEGESPMTPILYNIIACGGFTDDDISHENLGWWARMGRYIIHESDYGFVYSSRYDSVSEAEEIMAQMHAEFEEAEESEDGSA